MITSKSRILIVEADAAVRDACAAAAERLGCSVYSTAYIDDFEVVMAQLLPTVIVLDLNMLGRGGADLLNHLVDTDSDARVLLLAAPSERVVDAARTLAASIGLDTIRILRKPGNRLDLETQVQTKITTMLRDERPVVTLRPAHSRRRVFGDRYQGV
ncbi:MAG: response regulator [Pseudomonadota bacterium]